MDKKDLLCSIFIAPEAGHKMKEVSEVRAFAGKGLKGDRYASKAGSWSHQGGEVRDVTIISQEAFLLANEFRETPFLPRDTRRNLVVDISVSRLNSFVGETFWIGRVCMEGVELCTPCERPAHLTNTSGFREAFEGRGGLRARIIIGGILRRGESHFSSTPPVMIQSPHELKAGW